MSILVNIFGETLNTGGGGIPMEVLDNFYVNETGDEMKGELSMHNNTISNVADPKNEHDVATKKYVDAEIQKMLQLKVLTSYTIEERIPRFDSLSMNGFKLSVSGNYSSKYDWRKMFDNDKGSYWSGGRGREAWVMIEFPYVVDLIELNVTHRFNMEYFPAILMYIEKSMDGKTFNEFHVITNAEYVDRKPGVMYSTLHPVDGAVRRHAYQPNTNVRLKYVRYRMISFQVSYFGIYNLEGRGIRNVR